MLKKIISVSITAVFLFGCSSKNKVNSEYTYGKAVELKYAEQFYAEYVENDCVHVKIGEDDYIIVPEGRTAPEALSDAVKINQPVSQVYNAASSAMDLINGVGAIDKVGMTSTKENDWTLEYIRDAIKSGDITYIGKYSAPDYEALLECDCDLAIESTMIYHSPEVREQIEALGIPVLVERSSYESNPLGRMEWIKLYGLIFDCEDKANQLFDEKESQLAEILSAENAGKKVAFFYINSSGGVVVRKPADYVPEMIRMAGGEYIFTSEDLNTNENALSTMTIQPETFYEKAQDADILIYNSDITGSISSVGELISKFPLIADFKAVQEKNVWCSEKNVFQQSLGAADMIRELHSIITGEADPEMTFIYRLEEK